MININGMQFNGNDLQIENGKVKIDGRELSAEEQSAFQSDVAPNTIMINIIGGTVNNVQCDSNVTINGTVVGNIQASGNVNCDNVGGSIKASGNINCDNVGGSATASGNIHRG